VRTPLNAIINYLEIALEGSLDQETRDNLAKSHSASKSLIYVINDLLDLTKTEEGQELIKDEIFDLPACIREATEPFKSEAKRKGIEYSLVEHAGLPQYVYGDQRRVRQAVANVTANAVQHTSEGSVIIELYVAEVSEHRAWVEIAVQDTGRGMSNYQLDALFRDLEQVSSELDDSTSVEEQTQGASDAARSLGLGLAVVARIVRNMDGQLRLKSGEGSGSRFVIQLPFELPPDDSPEAPESTQSGASSGPRTAVSANMPATEDGEVTLVDRGSGSSAPQGTSLAQKKSFEDARSIASQRSATSKGSMHSNKSDADRLIDAIQTPLGLGEAESETMSTARRQSRGAYYNPPAHDLQVERSASPPDQSARPSTPERSFSSPGGALGPQQETEQTGVQFVTDAKTPIKPVKVPEEFTDLPEQPQSSTGSRVLFELPDNSHATGSEAKTAEEKVHLQVLIAEDDPVNFKLLNKRLEKAGHNVFHAVNGEDCAQLYTGSPKDFDLVLMDMQVSNPRVTSGVTSKAAVLGRVRGMLTRFLPDAHCGRSE
jgi:CheY-like chemotaxis protein